MPISSFRILCTIAGGTPSCEASTASWRAERRSCASFSRSPIFGACGAMKAPFPCFSSITRSCSNSVQAFTTVVGLTRSDWARSRTDGSWSPGFRVPAAM